MIEDENNKINSKFDIIKSISKNAINNDGKLKPFTLQIEESKIKNAKTSDIFVLSDSTLWLEYGEIYDLPITITKKSLNHKPIHFEKFDINRFNDINKLFKNSVMIIQDKKGNNSKYKAVIIKDEINEGNYILISIHDKKHTGNRNYVNDIRTTFSIDDVRHFVYTRINKQDGKYWINKNSANFISGNSLDLAKPPMNDTSILFKQKK